MIARDRDSDSNGSLEERLYALNDANFNVTGLVNTSGTVVERYAYDPFGSVTYLNASWGTISSSAYDWRHLHQGGRLDSSSGFYHFRNRDYSPSLGRWASMDPIGYESEQRNLYTPNANNPITRIDPNGLKDTTLEIYYNPSEMNDMSFFSTKFDLTDGMKKRVEESYMEAVKTYAAKGSKLKFSWIPLKSRTALDAVKGGLVNNKRNWDNFGDVAKCAAAQVLTCGTLWLFIDPPSKDIEGPTTLRVKMYTESGQGIRGDETMGQGADYGVTLFRTGILYTLEKHKIESKNFDKLIGNVIAHEMWHALTGGNHTDVDNLIDSARISTSATVFSKEAATGLVKWLYFDEKKK